MYGAAPGMRGRCEATRGPPDAGSSLMSLVVNPLTANDTKEREVGERERENALRREFQPSHAPRDLEEQPGRERNAGRPVGRRHHSGMPAAMVTPWPTCISIVLMKSGARNRAQAWPSATRATITAPPELAMTA